MEKQKIVFDEVQLCERALASLKYFCEDALVEQIKKCFETNSPMPSALHDGAIQLYRQYLIVGGMVENYVHVQISMNGYHAYYWTSERGAELPNNNATGFHGLCQLSPYELFCSNIFCIFKNPYLI